MTISFDCCQVNFSKISEAKYYADINNVRVCLHAKFFLMKGFYMSNGDAIFLN